MPAKKRSSISKETKNSTSVDDIVFPRNIVTRNQTLYLRQPVSNESFNAIFK